MTLYGYARVSTRDQDLAGQVAELTAAGCASVYREKVSGAKTDRAELAKVIRRDWKPGTFWWCPGCLNILAGVSTRGAGFRFLRDT